jgi:hypothetical protein
LGRERSIGIVRRRVGEWLAVEVEIEVEVGAVLTHPLHLIPDPDRSIV